MDSAAARARQNRRLSRRLALLAAAMFGFGFLLVPLYDLFCEIAGIGIPKAEVAAPPAPGQQDASRIVTVEFVAIVNEQAPWEFHPQVATLKVHPGTLYNTQFLARNLTGQRLVGRAVPSIAPAKAAQFLRKTECFCFDAQEFGPQEARELGVQFFVDPAIPPYIDRLTLSYTMFVNQQVALRDGATGS